MSAQQPAATTVGPRTPVATGRRRFPHEGIAELLGHGPIDPGLLPELLTDPAGLPIGLAGLQIRRLCVDRTGQVVAADPGARPLARLLDSPASPAGPTAAATLLTRLGTDLPAPPPRTEAHDPTAPQTRVIRARDRTCCFPGCAYRARNCDLDHRVRYPDGPTSTANLSPLCRHHHRLKHDGWTCRRHPDGTTTWTSPRGQQRRNPPP